MVIDIKVLTWFVYLFRSGRCNDQNRQDQEQDIWLPHLYPHLPSLWRHISPPVQFIPRTISLTIEIRRTRTLVVKALSWFNSSPRFWKIQSLFRGKILGLIIFVYCWWININACCIIWLTSSWFDAFLTFLMEKKLNSLSDVCH